MKVALVHDYLNEFGGAERVLEVLAEMYPDAPIYTAFCLTNSPSEKRFRDRDIRTSWVQHVPHFATKLHSPLRFITPLIWESFNLDEYDLVISSASWYITKGVITRPETVHICYCHTPPRYLYGYETSSDLQKYWLVRQYAKVVNPMLRKYDYLAAQRVDHFIANSENVKRRINKFYRRDATVIYPPVEIKLQVTSNKLQENKRNYYLTGGRLVGPKHFDIAIQVANKLKIPLKIYGDGPMRTQLQNLAGDTVEFVGRVNEKELASLYAGAKAFIALATDEDFGITPIEAMMAGTPVVAYKGGGYLETVVEGKTGIFVDELSVDKLVNTIKKLQATNYKPQAIQKYAQKFSKQRFIKEMSGFVDSKVKH